MSKAILILGSEVYTGAYVLHITLAQPCQFRLGRFREGRWLKFEAGDYIYVGSAMGRRGATSLPHRLLRHATRSGSRPAHRLRPSLLSVMNQAGLADDRLQAPSRKTLHWHIDYILDSESARLTGVVALRSDKHLESGLAWHLSAVHFTRVPVTGVGATDKRQETHFLQLYPPGWPGVVEIARALAESLP
jgi:Uri superfamily endonuclease